MSTTQILVLIVVLLLLLFAISRYFTKQDYRSKGGAPFILYKSDIEKIYNAIYDNSDSLKDYGLDDDDKVIIEEAFDAIVSAIGKSFKTKRNLGKLDKSLHSLKARYEQLKSLEQKVDESHNKRLEANTFVDLKNAYKTKQNENKASDFYKNRQLNIALDAWRRQARINKETNIIDEAKEGIKYESRECHIHKVADERTLELLSSLSDEAQNDDLRITEPNRMNDFEKAQDTLREKQIMIEQIEQQTEKAEIENSLNEERANEEPEIAEVSKNETINDDNNGEQNNQTAQQDTEEPMNPVDEKEQINVQLTQQNIEEPMNTDNEQQNPNMSGGRGLSIYNYGFLEAYIHFKIIEGVRLIEVINRMNNGILRIQCTGNYILDIIPVKYQFDIPFDWRRKEGIKKTSICTSFDIYRAKDRDNVEWCIYKGVDGNKDFEVYLNKLQNPNPVASDFLRDADDSSDSAM